MLGPDFVRHRGAGNRPECLARASAAAGGPGRAGVAVVGAVPGGAGLGAAQRCRLQPHRRHGRQRRYRLRHRAGLAVARSRHRRDPAGHPRCATAARSCPPPAPRLGCGRWWRCARHAAGRSERRGGARVRGGAAPRRRAVRQPVWRTCWLRRRRCPARGRCASETLASSATRSAPASWRPTPCCATGMRLASDHRACRAGRRPSNSRRSVAAAATDVGGVLVVHAPPGAADEAAIACPGGMPRHA